jgi:hypothetical protein
MFSKYESVNVACAPSVLIKNDSFDRCTQGLEQLIDENGGGDTSENAQRAIAKKCLASCAMHPSSVLEADSCLKKCTVRSNLLADTQEGYKPLSPFLEDSRASRSKVLMWLIVLVLLSAVVFLLMKKK